MKRHSFAMDLLKPDVTKEDIISSLMRKQELTLDDVDQIMATAVKIIAATESVLNQQGW